MNKEKIKPIEVPKLEITESTSEEEKIEYFFKLYTKYSVELENFKLDIKDIKKDVKEAGFEPARLNDAIKYMEKDGINKKAIEADYIDKYMLELKKLQNNEKTIFEGLEEKFLRLLELEEETKENLKGVKDKMGEVGIDKKAIPQIVKDFVKEQNPNVKPKREDIDLEMVKVEYNNKLDKSKQDVIPLPINKIE